MFLLLQMSLPRLIRRSTRPLTSVSSTESLLCRSLSTSLRRRQTLNTEDTTAAKVTKTTPPPLKIDYYPNKSPVARDENTVDGWELKAARRALWNLKTLLHGKMQDLIQQQIDEADVYYKEIIAASDGKWKECRADLHVTGVTAKQLMQYRQKIMKTQEEGKDNNSPDFILSIHPEHYMLPPYPEGIVEVIGEHMARLRIRVTDDVPDFVMEYGDPNYPMKKPTVGELDDGTVLFYILHEFRNSDNGCDLILRLIFPAAAPQVFFDEHAEHLCIEFRRGVKAAYEDAVEEAKGS